MKTFELGWKIVEISTSGDRKVWLVAETDPREALKIIRRQAGRPSALEILEAIPKKELDSLQLTRGSFRKIS